MTVVDLRELFFKRDIYIITVSNTDVYYYEKLCINDVNTVYFYRYNITDKYEYFISCVTDSENYKFIHCYVNGNSIIVLFENKSNKVLVIKFSRKTNEETIRKTLPLIGVYCDCRLIDDEHILVYSQANDEYREIFDRYIEETGFDVIANLYDLDRSYRYFVKDFRTAMLVRGDLHMFTDEKGIARMIISEPYCKNIDDKNRIITKQTDTPENICDSILEISKDKFLEGVKNGKEKLKLRCIASAGAEGSVTPVCAMGNCMIFKAKIYKNNKEQYLKMYSIHGNVVPVGHSYNINGSDRIVVDSVNEKIFSYNCNGDVCAINGEMNSSADIIFPYYIGNFINCTDDRFVIADSSKSADAPCISVYDDKIGAIDTYQAKAKIIGNTLIIY